MLISPLNIQLHSATLHLSQLIPISFRFFFLPFLVSRLVYHIRPSRRMRALNLMQWWPSDAFFVLAPAAAVSESLLD